jgi:glycosyltransferase involved in cell wall biosynthesis
MNLAVEPRAANIEHRWAFFGEREGDGLVSTDHGNFLHMTATSPESRRREMNQPELWRSRRHSGVSAGAATLPRLRDRTIKVLFMQSQSINPRFTVHADLMRSFDRAWVETHVAYRPGKPLEDVLSGIPDIHCQGFDLGPTSDGLGKKELARRAAQSAVPVVRDAARLARYVKANRIDIIHSGEDVRESFYGHWLSRLTGAKCVLHMHVKYNDWINPLSRWAIRNADGVISVSSFASEHLERAGLPAERVHTVLNGLPVEHWDPAVVDGSRVRDEYGIDRDTPLLVMIAGLRPTKGQRTLLDALSRVVTSHPQFRLLIVGDEDVSAVDARGAYTEELRQIVAKEHLQDHVVFTGRRADVPQILAAADIYTMPTFEDACPLSFLEAMAMGKPVIALESGGIPELVDAGKTGLLSPVDDAERLVENILALLEDPVRRLEMGSLGRRRFLEHFTARRMADDVERVYRMLLN